MVSVNPRSWEAYQLLHEGTLAFSRAERQGFRIDIDYVDAKIKQLYQKQQDLEEEFKQTNFYKHWEHSVKGKVNLNSGDQLGHFLYDVRKIEPAKTTKTGKGSTDEEALQSLDIPELDFFIQRTKIKKTLDVLEGFQREQVNGYVHPFYNLHTVVTYRSSSDRPNFQNIPKRDEEQMKACRRALFPRPGHQLMEVDFSGVEVRVAACYHKDPNMIRYIKDPTTDMHGDMAKQIFLLDSYDKSTHGHKVLRQAAKNGFVFPEFYGSYYKTVSVNLACTWGKLPKGKWKKGQGIQISEDETLSDHLIANGIRSLDAFEGHMKEIEQDFWEVRFPDYNEWRERWFNIYKKYGYFDTLTGFRCSGLMEKKEVINYPVQGSAFHCNLWSFIQVDKLIQEENWDTKLVGQIHDSMILDVNTDELDHVAKTIQRITSKDLLEHYSWIIVPMEVEMELCPIDASWMKKEVYKNE